MDEALEIAMDATERGTHSLKRPTSHGTSQWVPFLTIWMEKLNLKIWGHEGCL
jgi:hypothetical protein